MNWRKWFFDRPTPVTDLETLADFVDRHAAFVVQKGIYEYARARAGHYAKVLFAEKDFLDAVERSRWSAFPLGLAMVGELVEGVLRPHAGSDHAEQRERLNALVLSVFDRYPKPAALAEQAWRDARADLARRLQLTGLHPPKPAMDIPEPFVKSYFDLMPIDKKLRASEYPTIRSYLRVTMCNVHDELAKLMDAPAIGRLLLGGRSPAPSGPGAAALLG